MSDLYLEYDPWRGGFCLHFGRHDGGLGPPQDTIWNAPRLKLRGLSDEPFLSGSFLVDADRCRIGPIQIRQDQQTLEVWFTTGEHLPRDHWRYERHTGLGVYYSSKMAKPYGGGKDVPIVAGLVYSWGDSPAALYPVQQLHVAIEDFK